MSFEPEDLLTMPDGDRFEIVDGQLVEKSTRPTLQTSRVRWLIHHVAEWKRPTTFVHRPAGHGKVGRMSPFSQVGAAPDDSPFRATLLRLPCIPVVRVSGAG
jgi:hypothetical protein